MAECAIARVVELHAKRYSTHKFYMRVARRFVAFVGNEPENSMKIWLLTVPTFEEKRGK
jgi:hypothetical protein